MNRDVGNRLLRTELSAAETYQRVIREKDWKQLRDKANVQQIFNILVGNLQEHIQAASQLKAEIEQMGSSPLHASEAWGGSSKLAKETAHHLDDKAALETLKLRDLGCLKNYQDVLEDMPAPHDTKPLIKRLAAKQQMHVNALNELMARN